MVVERVAVDEQDRVDLGLGDLVEDVASGSAESDDRDPVAAISAVDSGESCLVEVAFAPQTADSDGDFAQAMVAEDQYEIIQS